MARTYEVDVYERGHFHASVAEGPGLGGRLVHIPGFPAEADWVQFFRAKVYLHSSKPLGLKKWVQFTPRWLNTLRPGPTPCEHMLLNSYDLKLTASLKHEIERHVRSLFPPFIISYVQDSSDGRASLEASSNPDEVAAFQAVVMYRFGWDCSKVIHVQIGSAAFDVTVRGSNEGCEADVEVAASALAK
jgi:hypothetical protein